MVEELTCRALQFALVPDASAGRRLRRMLATAGARSGVVVGTWHDLLNRAREACFIAAPPDDEAGFEHALGQVARAFWQESLGVAQAETARAVRRELIDLVAASDPGQSLAGLDLSALGERPQRRMGDFQRLIRLLEARLPGDLEVMRRLLRVDSTEASRPLFVHRIIGWPRTSRWQDAVIEKLNGDAARAGATPEREVALLLEECRQGRPSADPASALGALQRCLFDPRAPSTPVDGTAQWLRVRDFYQEAETVAGMTQRLLAADPALEPRSIGLLVPDSFEYSVALEDAFQLGGLALSGLASERWQRDLGSEAVFHFLFCRQKPAPAMALAVCFSSRLMPWSPVDGAQMAQAVMDGDYSPRLPARADGRAVRMRELLLAGDAEPGTLAQALADFASLLGGGDRFAAHAQRARESVGRVLGQLAGAETIEWAALRRSVNPELMAGASVPRHNLEGVTVWREGEEPWRHVRHLFVLGFSHGRYPALPRPSPVFSEAERSEIRNRLDVRLELRAERQIRLRELFRRQLAAVSGSVTFLLPGRAPDGTPAAPSDSLPFIERLLAPAGTAPGLIAALDSAADRGRIRNLALAAPGAPAPPRGMPAARLRFGRDLLALRADEAGSLRPESPSSLETLLTSPLAWLLRRVRAQPLEWSPETADPALLGSLAHGIFEDLFAPGRELLAAGEVAERVEGALESCIQQQAPFFRSPHWRVERRTLAAEASRAARAWRRALDDLGATVLGSEQWLRGEALDIPIVGKADLILGVGEDCVLIVDYKWSKSQDRRTRMERGYESQASLYREMARTGGIDALHEAGPAQAVDTSPARLPAVTNIGIVYFNMRDEVCLSDAGPPGARSVTGWQAIESDVAGEAIGKIRRHLRQAREGEIAMNVQGDRQSFKKDWGLTAFAFDLSPLVELFSEEEGGQDA